MQLFVAALLKFLEEIMPTNNIVSNTCEAFPKYKRTFYDRFIKRLFDIIVSAFALTLLSPVFLLTALAVRIKLGAPIFFKQTRVGMNETSFCLVKFRSMRDGKDKNGHFLPDCQRLTAFGRFLRSTSLDELPEFWNILKGDMSLIGPRPLPECYRPYFKQEERLRHAVRGGLTGLAQVNGRNAISWDDRFALDVEYVQNISFKTDMKIVFATVGKVLGRADIGERGVSSPEDLDVLRQPQPWYTQAQNRKSTNSEKDENAL